MTKNNAIQIICEEIIAKTANHLFGYFDERNCICDICGERENDSDINSEIIEFIVLAVNKQIEENERAQKIEEELKKWEQEC